jgi:hypothetical protein
VRCLVHAIQQYRKHGGYIAMRRTRILLWPFPHFLWIPPECPKGGKCIGIESFVPAEGHRYHVLFPPLWFKGHVKKGD